MDPDFGLEVEGKKAADSPPRPRPSVFVRGMEITGLALVIYGLASNRFGIAALGGLMIVGSYVLYRRTHGQALPNRSDDGPAGPDADGGDD